MDVISPHLRQSSPQLAQVRDRIPTRAVHMTSAPLSRWGEHNTLLAESSKDRVTMGFTSTVPTLTRTTRAALATSLRQIRLVKSTSGLPISLRHRDETSRPSMFTQKVEPILSTVHFTIISRM